MERQNSKDNTVEEQKKTSPSQQKEYTTPQLTEYGKVAQITGGRPGTTRDFGGTSPAFPG